MTSIRDRGRRLAADYGSSSGRKRKLLNLDCAYPSQAAAVQGNEAGFSAIGQSDITSRSYQVKAHISRRAGYSDGEPD